MFAATAADYQNFHISTSVQFQDLSDRDVVTVPA